MRNCSSAEDGRREKGRRESGVSVVAGRKKARREMSRADGRRDLWLAGEPSGSCGGHQRGTVGREALEKPGLRVKSGELSGSREGSSPRGGKSEKLGA